MALFLHQIAWNSRWVRPMAVLKGGGMPPYTSKTMELLVAPRSISKRKWLELLESRRESLGTFFKSTTLMRLGEVVCLRTKDSEATLGSIGTLRSTSGFDGNATQGIFGDPFAVGYLAHINLGSIAIWGLTRDGHWVIATVGYTERHGKGSAPDLVAVTLSIKSVSLAQMLEQANVKPFEVWVAIENAVMRATQQAQLRANTLQKLASRLNGETAALLAMSKEDSE